MIRRGGTEPFAKGAQDHTRPGDECPNEPGQASHGALGQQPPTAADGPIHPGHAPAPEPVVGQVPVPAGLTEHAQVIPLEESDVRAHATGGCPVQHQRFGHVAPRKPGRQLDLRGPDPGACQTGQCLSSPRRGQRHLSVSACSALATGAHPRGHGAVRREQALAILDLPRERAEAAIGRQLRTVAAGERSANPSAHPQPPRHGHGQSVDVLRSVGTTQTPRCPHSPTDCPPPRRITCSTNSPCPSGLTRFACPARWDQNPETQEPARTTPPSPACWR